MTKQIKMSPLPPPGGSKFSVFEISDQISVLYVYRLSTFTAINTFNLFIDIIFLIKIIYLKNHYFPALFSTVTRANVFRFLGFRVLFFFILSTDIGQQIKIGNMHVTTANITVQRITRKEINDNSVSKTVYRQFASISVGRGAYPIPGEWPTA